jgi:hypothetical protein
MLNRAFLQHYKCSKCLAEFSLNGKLSSDSGYFRFGTSTICYGQSTVGWRARHPLATLYDTRGDAAVVGSHIDLPFDPNRVIDNLRLERYAADCNLDNNQRLSRRLLRFAYYAVRPVLSVGVRRHVQKAYFKGRKKLPFPHWPVDHTVEDIMEQCLVLAMMANGLTEIPFIWFWPNGAQACAVMTHDVETRLGRDFSAKLMDINDEFQIKASFQVVPEKRYDVPDTYLNAIQRRGFEVAVQDLNHDGHLYSERNEFLRRAELIRQYRRKFGATGFRAAILYRNLDWLPELNFSYDMSVPNVALLDPQSGGCCTLFPYFIGDTLEIPVTMTQDYSLFNIIGDYTLDLWKQQTSRILEKHGLMNFIVHPDYIVERKPQQTYRDLLAYLSTLRAEQNLWIPLPHEVDGWWRARDQMELVDDGGTWRIQGAGSERASVAFARLDDGEVTYCLAENASRR